MKIKKEQKINANMKNIKYIIFIGIIILCIINFIALIKVENGLYDTFFAYDVNFTANADRSYSMTFGAISAQNKSYSNNKLVFHFKCYDKNGVLLDDNVQAVVRKGDFRQINSYNHENAYSHAESVSYCELNYVRILD